MAHVLDRKSTEAPANYDLVTTLHRVLQSSSEPLTLPRIRSLLPAAFRSLNPQDLMESLRRQLAANVLWQYPKYRSQLDRFWDRPMPVHVAVLLRTALQDGPLAWSVLRRKLPAYAQVQAEAVLKEQVVQGLLFRHPRAGRSGERFGLRPPDPKEYLRPKLAALFHNLGKLGFHVPQLRICALELLHEEEWGISAATPASSVS